MTDYELYDDPVPSAGTMYVGSDMLMNSYSADSTSNIRITRSSGFNKNFILKGVYKKTFRTALANPILVRDGGCSSTSGSFKQILDTPIS